MRSLRLALPFAGLLALGCPTVDTGDTPIAPGSCRPDPGAFEGMDGIWGLTVVGTTTEKTCINKAGCHGIGMGARSSLRLIDNPATAADWASNYDAVTRFLNCATPSASTFITRPKAGIDSHGGGDLWSCLPSDMTCEIYIVEQWISGG